MPSVPPYTLYLPIPFHICLVGAAAEIDRLLFVSALPPPPIDADSFPSPNPY